MEKFFKLKEKGTDVRTEMIAGITTFMTMAYILAVNPSVLGATGMDSGAIFTATALASYFAYTVVLGMGYSWEVALTAVFAEGLVFILLSLTNVREAIFNAIPQTLKYGVSVGIGLFICFIGLQNAHIAVDSATLVTIFSFSQSVKAGTFNSEGITVLLALIGIIITGYLVIKGVKGNILIGIFVTWILGILCQLAGIYVPNPDAGFYSLIPSGVVSMPASIAPTLFKFDFSIIAEHPLDFFSVLFAFLFVDIFDTLGTLIGCASKADMLDKDGKLPEIKGALLADSIGTMVGACLGTSTITTFVESSSGIAEGGRSGLTAIVSGLFFLLALFFSPIFLAIPSFATAPALVIVGFLMIQQVVKVEWDDLLEAIPAYIAIFAMPFLYSISEGISLGIISYVLLHVLSGKGKSVTPLMYVLAILFVLKYAML